MEKSEKEQIILALNEAIHSHDHTHAELQDLIDTAEELKSDVINTRSFLQGVYAKLTKPQPENQSE